MKIMQNNLKQELRKKQCVLCRKTRIYSLRLKGFLAYIFFLWGEYNGRVLCTECFASIREA